MWGQEVGGGGTSVNNSKKRGDFLFYLFLFHDIRVIIPGSRSAVRQRPDDTPRPVRGGLTEEGDWEYQGRPCPTNQNWAYQLPACDVMRYDMKSEKSIYIFAIFLCVLTGFFLLHLHTHVNSCLRYVGLYVPSLNWKRKVAKFLKRERFSFTPRASDIILWFGKSVGGLRTPSPGSEGRESYSK